MSWAGWSSQKALRVPINVWQNPPPCNTSYKLYFMYKYHIFLLKHNKLGVVCSLSAHQLLFWKSSAEFSGMRLSSVLTNAVGKFEGFKLWQGKDTNLDTKTLAPFQNLKLAYSDLLTKPSLISFILSTKLPNAGAVLNWWTRCKAT